MKKLILISLVAILNSTAHAAAWPTQNQWSADWETKFSQWVEESWNDDIFMDSSSPVHGVATDCADASYTMRMLFSYLNKLPFKIHDPANKGQFITNATSAFDNIADGDERFRAFVNNVNDLTNSATLADDTYPIAINRTYFRPGIVYVAPDDHTYQIKSLTDSGEPVVISSTVPRDNRYLLVLNSFPFYMPKSLVNHQDGYRAFKQPQFYGMNESSLPGYSLQQYQIAQQHPGNILAFDDALGDILQTRPETPDEKVNRGLINLCSAVQNRAVLISWTEFHRSQNNYACMSAATYESESTPSRDHAIAMMFSYLQDLYNAHQYDPDSETGTNINELFSSDADDSGLRGLCAISRYGNIPVDLSLRDIWVAMKNKKLISDPNANMLQRWGQQDYTATCPTY